MNIGHQRWCLMQILCNLTCSSYKMKSGDVCAYSGHKEQSLPFMESQATCRCHGISCLVCVWVHGFVWMMTEVPEQVLLFHTLIEPAASRGKIASVPTLTPSRFQDCRGRSRARGPEVWGGGSVKTDLVNSFRKASLASVNVGRQLNVI